MLIQDPEVAKWAFPLDLAVLGKYKDLVEFFISLGSPISADALIYSTDQPDLLAFLLDQIDDANVDHEGLGKALVDAAEESIPESVILILEKMKKNWMEEYQKSMGDALFVVASGGGKNATHIAEILLMSGADPDHVTEEQGGPKRSPLMAAAVSNEQDTYALLMKYGKTLCGKKTESLAHFHTLL